MTRILVVPATHTVGTVKLKVVEALAKRESSVAPSFSLASKVPS